MRRRQMEEWGIRFLVAVNGTGYSWKQVPWKRLEGDHAVYLAPNPVAVEGVDGTKVQPGQSGEVIRIGRGVARDAYKAFRNLAVALAENPIPETNTEGMFPERNQEQLVVNFANDHGTLWGDDAPGTLKDWQGAATEFLDLLDIAKALVSGEFHQFDRRVGSVRGPDENLAYFGRHRRSKPMIIARPGNAITTQNAPNALPQRTDFYETSVEGSSRTRAQMLFQGRLNVKLAGGLSVGILALSSDEAFVVPRHLIHLLYVRMWRDTVSADLKERKVTCGNPTCGREIQDPKTKRRKFCSDECRWELNNKRRAARS